MQYGRCWNHTEAIMESGGIWQNVISRVVWCWSGKGSRTADYGRLTQKHAQLRDSFVLTHSIQFFFLFWDNPYMRIYAP